MKTLVLGLGNPILRDDSVGFHIVRELRDRIDREDVVIQETGLSGLKLLDILTGYEKAIIIDAIETRESRVGQIQRLGPEAFDDARHLSSVHDVNFATALDLGRRLNMALPEQIVVFTIEVEDTSTFSEECTVEVRRAIPVCVEMIVRELDSYLE